MPKISIILTSFNHEKYIREAIDSVLTQSFTDFELIIWDDASIDNSWRIIKSYSDSRIKSFRNNEYQRAIYGVNKAITEIASGEYIALQHSDDLWEKDKLEKQIEFLDTHSEVGAVFTNARAIGEDGEPLNDAGHFYSTIFDQPNRTRHEWLNYFFYHGNALCHPSVLIRKRCYTDCGNYRYGFAQVGDLDMWIRLCLKYEIFILQEKLIRFRVRANEANTSGSRPETRIRGVTEFYQLFTNYLRLNPFDEFVAVFPEAERFYRENGFVPEFVLAMLSLEPNALHMAKAFGSISLFNLLQDAKTSEEIKELYDFDYRKLIELTGKYDIFSLETVATLNKIMTERDAQVADLNQAIAERDKQILTLNQSVAEHEKLSPRIIHGNSWRLTLPLRETRRWVSNPRQQSKRYLQKALPIAKRAYQALPLSHQKKTAHRLLLAKYFPWVLRGGNSQPLSICHPPMTVVASNRIITDHYLAASNINLAISLQPLVSIIIPIYGKADYTLRCLISIMENPPSAPFEVIVIDDCSPDESVEILRCAEGLQLICNRENQGFIKSCNTGAKAARGKYICFLNNDTEVKLGWLDELVRTFSEFPGTGLAGSKLIYPDGRLQEAGGIIWKDGNAWNFGRDQHQLLPIYNYAREVDYCSGASIMVPKALFDKLGGFDEHYLPAYCEDADLALKIRDCGHRVIYQPLSVVVHHEGITSGTDTTQGTKTYQIKNSKKLFDRWKDRLQHHQELGIDVYDAKDRMAKRRVLVLDYCTPTPNQDAGSVTVFNLMLLLREMGFQVTFIPEDNFLYMPDYTPALQRVGIEVLYAPYCTTVEQHLKEFGGRYDLAFLFRPGVVERHLNTIHKHSPKAKVIFHTVDLHYLRMSREASLHGDAAKHKAADEMKHRELAAIRAADLSIVHSTVELELLRPELPNELIHVFPLIMDIRGTDKTFKGRRDVVFVGGYQHPPNIDAVRHFVNDIMPFLRRRLPGVRFYAVGSKPSAEILALASEDVIITGFVEDLPPLLDQMRVSVAPLRYGAGIKGKIGTAMAVGLPTVATSQAAEGMSLINGENILVADKAEAFADAVTRVYENELLWNKLSKSGLHFAEKNWGAEAAYRILDKILNAVGIESSEQSCMPRLYNSPPRGQCEVVEHRSRR